jgi:hypothetical protein
VAGRSPEADDRPSFPIGPPWAVAAAVGLVLFAILIANGRPIGAGDTRPTERVAASLVGEADFDLDEFPEVEDPFARTVGAHRVSIYPVLSAVLAAPVFLAAQAVFLLDETGTALAGKWAASLFTAVAAVVLFLIVGRRHPHVEAAWTAALFALGTSMWSTSQALWQHPAAVLFLCVAVLFLSLAERDAVWAGRSGLPLALAVAARHADVALVAVLVIGIAVRWPRRLPALLAWAAPVAALLMAYQWSYFGSPLRHGFSGSGARFSEPWGHGHLGLLASPAKGLLVFTPVVIAAVAGLWSAYRKGERWPALTLGAAAAAHWIFMGRWSEWHGGESWGPRMMTDALPLLFVFLPDGFNLMPRVAPALAAVSVAVQALGAFSYDYRWERLHWRGAEGGRVPAAALWDVVRSPIPFYLQRRVAIFALPAVRDGRVYVREHPVVVLGPTGSRVIFSSDPPRVEGAEATMEDVHLQRGARVDDGRVRLRGRWDGVQFRVGAGARRRRLELRLSGRGQGVLYVGEKTFWSEQPRWATYPVSGPFRLRHPYDYATSGGPDVIVTIGKSPGEIDLESMALVAPGDPANPVRVP